MDHATLVLLQRTPEGGLIRMVLLLDRRWAGKGSDRREDFTTRGRMAILLSSWGIPTHSQLSYYVIRVRQN